MAEGNKDQRLQRGIERIELIDAEIAELQESRREELAQLKGQGYHLGTVRAVLLRRKLSPAERAEADALVEIYEAALDGSGPATSVAASARDLASALLAEQLAAIEDPERAAAVVEHVLARLDIRAEIAVLRGQDAARGKLAGDEGFDRNQITATVRWYEKCAKHGPEAMKAGEQVFRAYRGTVDEAGGPVRPDGMAPSADEKLNALFGKPAPKAPTAKQKAVSDAVAMARLNRPAPGPWGGR